MKTTMRRSAVLWAVRVPRKLGQAAIEAAQRDSGREVAGGLSATALLGTAAITPNDTRVFVEGPRGAVERFAVALGRRARGATPTIAR